MHVMHFKYIEMVQIDCRITIWKMSGWMCPDLAKYKRNDKI